MLPLGKCRNYQADFDPVGQWPDPIPQSNARGD
jgi:hypothetical protein